MVMVGFAKKVKIYVLVTSVVCTLFHIIVRKNAEHVSSPLFFSFSFSQKRKMKSM